MRVLALSCNRYRVFKDRKQIELAPVTIVIGKNGSGKSVLSRLPVLIAGGISTDAGGPLDLRAGSIEHAASFQDLVNERGSLPFSLGMTVGNNVTSLTFETTLRYVHESRSLVVERFDLLQEGRLAFSAEISNADQLVSRNPTFKVSGAGHEETNVALRFQGLLPEPTSLKRDSRVNYLATHLASFRTALPMPSYLGPFRAEPTRSLSAPNQGIRDLGPRGERALDIMADDRLRHDGSVSRAVSEWFSGTMGQSVDVDVSGDLPIVKVTPLASSFQVSLADTGAGYSQSVPVVVQHMAYRARRIQSNLLIVEQPELHLHPGAHGDLADLILSSSLEDSHWPSATCIVETHSEQLIMRMRRRIAERGLHGRVVLYSLDHKSSLEDDEAPIPLQKITFDAAGNPSDWPLGVFEEALSDLTAMRRSARSPNQ